MSEVPVRSVDINCDLGESYGRFIVGQDDRIFPHITSCNIACGFHGGDPVHMERTVRAALKHGVQIGAHPSYPDRWGFGRRHMQLTKEELIACVRYQVSALTGIAQALGGRVRYVKPHGALYNTAMDSEKEAEAIAEAVVSVADDLALLGMPDSALERTAHALGITYFREAFADRRYQAHGRLMPREHDGAVIRDPGTAAAQALSIVLHNSVQSSDGMSVSCDAESICVHGDHPESPSILAAIDEVFTAHGIEKRACIA